MNSACLLWKRSVLPANGSAPNELKIVNLTVNSVTLIPVDVLFLAVAKL